MASNKVNSNWKILKNRLFLILKGYMIILDIDVLKSRRILNDDRKRTI